MASDSESSSSDSSSGSGHGSKSKLKKMEKHHKKEMRDRERKEKRERKAKEKMEKREEREEERQEKYWKHQHQDLSVYGAAASGGTVLEHLSSAPAPMFPPRSQGAPNPPPYAPSPGFPQVNEPSQFPPPPIAHNPPPSGVRIPLRTDSDFAPPNQAGPPAAYDADGSPVFIGSALFETSVHPCKIGPHLQPHALVPYGGTEHGHHGRYDLLPFVPEQMEWVHTSHGRIPHGRRPIEGGYEENGGKLYHALAHVDNIRVPGKTGEHLGGANVSFGGQELVYQEYEILCWK